jgi:hypothetical protein
VSLKNNGGLPMANGIDWEARTGKPMESITTDDKLTVIISVLDQLNKSVSPMVDTCKIVSRHEVYWKIASVVLAALVVALVGLFVKVVFHV